MTPPIVYRSADDDLTYDFKSNVAKSCIELGKFTAASELLEALLQEDDRSPEIWYLLAFAYHHAGDNESAMQYLQTLQQVGFTALHTYTSRKVH